MNGEPRHQGEYSPRQTDAARRVLIDLAQTLAAFEDCLVVVGGWVPDLLMSEADEPHIGSIDVDLALDAAKLGDGRYAELVQTLLTTRRYLETGDAFKLYTMVDLGDDLEPVRVDVDFLKAPEAKTKKNRQKLMPNFRPLDAAGCATAFRHPELIARSGQMISGARNTVRFRVASLADFLIMKCYALKNRDKPKDAYDICYCMGNYPGSVTVLAACWKERHEEQSVIEAMEILREKFPTIDGFGPLQVVEFYNSANPEERAMHGRRAYELVRKFLSLL